MSEKITKLIEDVKALTVLELSELVKALEEEFGVSAAAPVAVAAAPVAAAPAEEEQTEFDVILAAHGQKKIDVIKAVRVSDKLKLVHHPPHHHLHLQELLKILE
jgi:large subunit ribosomal protein L7/L12